MLISLYCDGQRTVVGSARRQKNPFRLNHDDSFQQRRVNHGSRCAAANDPKRANLLARLVIVKQSRGGVVINGRVQSDLENAAGQHP